MEKSESQMEFEPTTLCDSRSRRLVGLNPIWHSDFSKFVFLYLFTFNNNSNSNNNRNIDD